MRHRHQGRRAADAVGRHGGRFPYRRHDAHHGAPRIAEAAMTTCRRRTRALSRKTPAGQVPGDSSWPGCRATTAARACHGPPAHPLAKFLPFRDTCRSTRALTAHPARSVHEGCASVARRGTNLLAGRGTARTATAGTRPRPGSVRTAGSGPGGDLGPGRRRRRTRQPAPSPVTAAWPAPSLTTFRLPRVHSGDEGALGMRGDRHGSRAERRLRA